ncbi:MAG: hypothetical protein JNK72_15780 [Myxococcales bacterium]|nr:hypothetical protein [Myxococcales bacterium]
MGQRNCVDGRWSSCQAWRGAFQYQSVISACPGSCLQGCRHQVLCPTPGDTLPAGSTNVQIGAGVHATFCPTGLPTGGITSVCNSTSGTSYLRGTSSLSYTDACSLPGASRFLQNNDDGTFSLTLPYNFAYYGNNFNTIGVSMNGMVSFPTASYEYYNYPLPYANIQNTVFAFWDDIYARGEGICFAVTGAAGSRRAIVQWQNSFFYYNNTPSTNINFEVVLHETSNIIDVLYGTMVGEGDRATGSSATIGIQQGSGSSFDQVSYNVGGAISSNSSIRWTPSTGSTVCQQGIYRRTFDGLCSPGEAPRWGQFNYTAIVPQGTSIDFEVRIADTEPALATAAPIRLPSANRGMSNVPTSIDIGAAIRAARPDLALDGRRYAQIIATLNPSPDRTVAPTLVSTETQFTCGPVDPTNNCRAGADCFINAACRRGRIECRNSAGGRPVEVCVDIGAQVPGTSCGDGFVCNPAGNCIACSEGTACDLGNVCALGRISCATGAPVCVVGNYAPTGTVCRGNSAAYTRSVSPLSWVNVCNQPGSSRLLPNVDDGATSVTLPFAFNWYGAPYSLINVSTNGMISFSSSAYLWQYVNTAIPYGNIPDTIFAFWDDLYPRTNGICAVVLGTAPNRQFVAQWDNNFFYYNNTPSTSINFEVFLTETSNTIDVRYGTMTGEGDRATGASATIGIQRDSGSSFDQVGYNTAGVVSSNSGIRWTPNVQAVCDGSGNCVECNAGSACALPGDACGIGNIACINGRPVCVRIGQQPVGTTCGTNAVCNSGGQCVPCQEGMACTASSSCRIASVTCTSGAPVCRDTGVLPPNTMCTTPGNAVGVCDINANCVTCFPEVCDGLDNDCDGVVDDNVTRSCYTGSPSTQGVGVCTAGTETCTAGSWGSCLGQVLPSTDVCNGRDDNCNGSVDEVYAALPTSCSQVNRTTPTGLFRVDPDGTGPISAYDAFCEMTANGGGWSLALKADGRATTFSYDAGYWTNTALLNNTVLNNSFTESKYPIFVNSPFNQVMLQMNTGGSFNALTQNVSAYASLQALFGSGTYVGSTAGRNNWLALLPNASLQPNCNREGFNNNLTYQRIRFGILGNNENDCASPDSRIGIGGNGNYCGSLDDLSVGQTARCGGSNGDTDIRSFGYMFVRNSTVTPNTWVGGSVGTTCSVGLGACQRTGAWACASNGLGTVCSATAGLASAEVCDGIDNDCDGVVDNIPANACDPTACSVGVTVCPATNVGTVVAPVCRRTGFAPNSRVCRPVAGACDTAEVCNGSSDTCPADTFQGGSTVCRAAVSNCDVAEVCSGTSANCPNDGFAPNTTVCRAAAGTCDVQETCTGSSSVCPNDALRPAGFVCRPTVNQAYCDPPEVCTGSNAQCPADIITRTPGAEVCDNDDNNCDGVIDEPYRVVPTSCSAINRTSPTGVYRIDPDGTGPIAAYDAFCDMGSVGGGWTLALKADGRNTTFVYDSGNWTNATLINAGSVSTRFEEGKFSPFTNVGFNNVLFIANTGGTARTVSTAIGTYGSLQAMFGAGGFVGTGVGRTNWLNLLPDASLQPNCNREGFNNVAGSTRIRFGILGNNENDCATPDSRIGIGGNGDPCGQVIDLAVGQTTRCGGANGDTDIRTFGYLFVRNSATPVSSWAGGTLGGSCTVGEGACQRTGAWACASNGAGTVCSATAGTPTGEICNGIDDDCDGVVDDIAPTACSPAACSVGVQVCPLTTAGVTVAPICRRTGFAPSSTVCRPSAGDCDVQENCNGSSDTCPADAFRSNATVCRAAAGACDAPESCSGTSALCPGDGRLTAGTVCRAAAGACDQAEVCNGSAITCPNDVLLPNGTLCRPSANVPTCDPPEYCNGSGPACPTDTVIRTPAMTDTCNGQDDDCDGYIDDPFVPGAPTNNTRLVYSESFESGATGWVTAFGPALTTPSEAGCSRNTRFLRDSTLSGGGRLFSPVVNVVGGQQYCVSGWIRGSAGTLPFVGIAATDAAGNPMSVSNWLIGQSGYPTGYGDFVTPVTSNGQWGWYAKTFTLQTTAQYLRLGVELFSSGGPGNADFDQLELHRGPCPTTPVQPAVGGRPETCNGVDDNCNGTIDEGLLGRSMACPAASCSALGDGEGLRTNGIYWIDPNGGATSDAFQAYCDLVTNNGGWTLTGRSRPGTWTNTCVGTDGTNPFGGGNFGWQWARGAVTDDVNPYSLNAVGRGVTFREVMFGDYTAGKTWGANIYTTTVPANFIAGFPTSSFFNTQPTVVQQSCPVITGGTNVPGMMAYMGYTTASHLFYFRDVPGPDFGLTPSGWASCYNDCYGGGLNGRQGQVMVREEFARRGSQRDLGANCTVGLGACQRQGTYICGPSGTLCSVTPGTASAEICNGLDDDCDGLVDENNPGAGQACSTGQPGICAAGTTACTGGTLVCNRNNNPTTETCNGVDDNCNGTVDDPFVTNGPVGACQTLWLNAASGTYTLDPDGDGGNAAFSVFCDNTTQGGGWAEVFRQGTLNNSTTALNYTLNNYATVANATQVLSAFRASSNAIVGNWATFGMPNNWRAQAPFRFQAVDEPVSVSINGAAAVAQTLRYGYATWSNFCTDNWVTSSNYGRICITNTTAPYFNAFAVTSGDFCSESTQGYAAVGCSTSRFYSLSVRANPGTVGGTCEAGVGACRRTGAYVCRPDGLGTACSVAPGSPTAEVCNGIDDDCDGVVDDIATSACSLGPCSTAQTACRTGITPGMTEAPICQRVGYLTTQCRASAGVCDVAEVCNGSSDACPTDSFAANTTQCRASVGVCDVAETCTGSSALCPADARTPAGTQCRASAGACDVAEACNGTSSTCPVDGFATNGTVCRVSAGVCDPQEVCPGNSAACPADGRSPNGTVCRPSVGTCDTAEVCNGTATTCPNDVVSPNGTVCRAVAGVCDQAETCNGLSGACPTDAPRPTGSSCTPPTGGSCNGFTCGCPTGTIDCGGTCTVTGSACIVGVGACARPGSFICTTTGAGGGAGSVSVGYRHSCATMTGGQIRCWGTNNYGQLGDGTTTLRTSPVTVTGVTTALEYASGWEHGCVRLANTTVQCWGRNTYGQLGNGSTATSAVPVTVSGLSGVTRISAGQNHSCAVLSNGTIRCWGYNGYGQLGDNTTTTRNTPTTASFVPNFVDVAAGGNHTCALRADRTVWCWGYNGYGQVGDGSTTNWSRPVPVVNLTDVTEITAGDNHSCARRSDGTVWCWGYNGYGQLGNSSTGTSYVPVQVTGLTTAVSVTAGDIHTCARLADGTARCWGYNGTGGLGDGTTTTRTSPVVVTGVTGVRSISAFYRHTCAVIGDTSVRCWGENSGYELGNGNNVDQRNAVVVTNLAPSTFCSGTPGNPSTESCNGIDDDCDGVVDNVDPSQCSTCAQPGGSCTVGVGACARSGTYICGRSGAQSVTNGYQHSCAVLTDRTVRCWGYNAYGQLGNGNTATQLNPVSVTGLTNVAQISAGYYFTCARLAGGTVRCWGYNGNGELGDGSYTQRLAPAAVSGLVDAVQISSGDSHSCAVRRDGSVWCWGYNGNGQLGTTNTTSRNVATQVVSLQNVTRVAAGGQHTCALRTDGTLWCWGYNGYGQYGDGSTTQLYRATPQLSLTNVVDVAAGSNHTCAILSDRTVRCWGYNAYGQLGNGTTGTSYTPVVVSGLTNAEELSLGDIASCARRTDGTVWCWGYNAQGALGDGTTTQRTTPVQVQGITGTTRALSIGTGYRFGCAASADGRARCWGYNANFQLGDTSQIDRPIAREVIALPPADQVCSATAAAPGTEVCNGIDDDCDGVVDDVSYSTCDACAAPSGSCTVGVGACARTGSFACGTIGARQVATGYLYSCALLRDNTVRCWGYNGNGQLGNSTNTNTVNPVSVTSLTGVASLNTGYQHQCALMVGGTVRCWGYNGYGNLGDGTSTTRNAPGAAVSGLSNITQVSAGNHHACGLRSDGTVWCWGYNYYGQLGDLTGTNRVSPVQVQNLFNVRYITAGANHTCAIKNDNTIWCWGYNGNGQFGDGSTNSNSRPTPGPSLANPVELTAGENHTCARLSNGTVWCWGYGGYGQLGQGSTASVYSPVQAVGITNAVQLTAGDISTCARLADGTIRCWGYNGQGNLGDGTTTQRTTPVTVSGVSTAVSVGSYYRHTCAALSNGAVQCWGDNGYGQLGDSTQVDRRLPVPVLYLSVNDQVCQGTEGAPSAESCDGADNDCDGFTDDVSFSACNACAPPTASCSTGVGACNNTGTMVCGTDASRSVAVGALHSCALLRDGTVRCWGYNGYGNLGDGTTTQRVNPVSVLDPNTSAPLRGVANLHGGYYFNCARMEGGTVRCWGYNGYGQLGDGTSTNRATAGVNVSGLTNAVQIAVGQHHVCALRRDGTVWCWGYNGNGQLGDNTNTNRTTPVQVVSLYNVRAIAAGYNHTCAIRTDNTMWCWGYNGYGQFGDGTTTASNRPDPIDGINTFSDVVAGDNHTCAIMTDRTVRCWGYNGYGQLGDGTTATRYVPTVVPNLNNVVELEAGDIFSCARLADGTARCWGYNGNGCLGDGTTTQRYVPTAVAGLAGVTDIAAHYRHMCANLSDGSVRCWGYNDYFQVGDSTAFQRNSSVEVLYLTAGDQLCNATPRSPSTETCDSIDNNCNGAVDEGSYSQCDACAAPSGSCSVGVGSCARTGANACGVLGGQQVVTGYLYSCAKLRDNTVRCWGYNGNGQLGNGTTTSTINPVSVTGLTNVASLAGGYQHVCAVMIGGAVRCWGYNGYGQLGTGNTTNATTPAAAISGLTEVTTVSTGQYHNCAVRRDGSLWCWGYNYYGQLGDNTGTTRYLPVRVTNLENVTDVACGSNHTCARRTDGTVWCWGYNGNGELGNGTTSNTSIPTPVPGLANVVDLEAGDNHTCARLTDGTIRCWGYNGYGQLGNGTTGSSTVPVVVSGISTAAQLAAANISSCARLADGTVRCWGYNGQGNLGDGTTTQRTTPTVVSGLAGAIDVATFYRHACAVLSNGTVQCWGDNSYGQIGDSTQNDRRVPFSVLYLTAGDRVCAGTPGAVASEICDGSDNNCNGVNDDVSYSQCDACAAPTGSCTRGVGACARSGTLSCGFDGGAEVYAGYVHTCSLLRDGRARCWGYNGYGQIGDGTTTNRLNPTTVSGLSGIVEMSAGDNHTCARLSGGTVRCWGYNGYGNLGDGSTATRTTPVAVSGLTNVTQVASMAHYNCAVRLDGTVWCWGYNGYGQLGDNTTTTRITPVQVQNLYNARFVAVGYNHACAIRTDSTVWCWGYNGSGQLGDGTTGQSNIAEQIRNFTAVELALGSDHSCARRSDGTVWCWGYNGNGQLGIGSTANQYAPVQVTGLSNARGITAGDIHTCARLADGTARCWGYNGQGGLGDGTTTQRTTSVAVSGLTGVTGISSNYRHTCARLSNADVRCWGNNDNGQVGDGTYLTRTTPYDVEYLSPDQQACSAVAGTPGVESCNGIDDDCNGVVDDVAFSLCNTCAPPSGSCAVGTGRCAATGTQTCGTLGAIGVAAQYISSCALMENGTIRCWGYNGYGNLGDGTTTQRFNPVTVSGVSTAVQVSGGRYHMCARLAGGTVQCWGYNPYGQLGDGTATTRYTPVSVTGVTNATQVSVSVNHSCALIRDGSVMCWGYNGNGELGDGTNSTRYTAAPVRALFNTVAIAVGENHACAARQDGTVRCWGYNQYGQLGNGNATARNSIDSVLNISGVTRLAAGASHTCAVRNDGTVWCWGYNGYGQLGNGSTATSYVPVQVSGISNAVDVTAGDIHSCARLSDGTARCWGYNAQGALGDGTTTQRTTPVVVSGLSGITDIASSYRHTCARLSNETVRCWGYNSNNQIGDGTTIDRRTSDLVMYLTPTDVTCTAAPGAPASETCNNLDDNCNGVIDDTNPSTCTSCNVGSMTCSAGVGACARTGAVACGNSGGVSLVVGYSSTCVVLRDGTVRCWGYNGNGRLGDGTTTNRVLPTTVPGITNALDGGSGDDYHCVRLANGTIRCWGYNGYGNLGDGTTTQRPSPVQVSGITTSVQVTAGIYHTCSRLADATVRCWGYNGYGQLGDGSTTNRYTPVAVSGLTGVVHVAAGGYHTCAVRNDGTVWCWGYNPYGNLGDGTATTRNTPVQVSGVTGAVAVSAGVYHTCALLSNGTVRCWGYNAYGQLGDASTTTRYTASTVSGLSTATTLTAGYYHTCARLSDATVRCWGYNPYGNLGDGTATSRTTPVQAVGVANATSVDSHLYHTCALLSSGNVECWGYNNYDQLGDGTFVDRYTAVDVEDLTGGTVCGATPGTPGVESCNGVDDDCNGLVDDIAATPCSFSICGVGRTVCSGTSTVCVYDRPATAGTLCRASAGACDVAESCNGSSNTCPADTFLSNGTICRASAGVCDPQEVCNGSSAACPADARSPGGTVCRPVAGGCDVAETCNGTSTTCPSDVLASNGTLCRASAGVCDPQETCNGSSAACPADARSPNGTVCRGVAGACDRAETCNGSATTCPADTYLTTTTVCRGSTGVCDPQEVCPGNSISCPSDALTPNGTLCSGPTGGVCATGTCVCPTGQTNCSGTCRNLQTDVNNCGACANACGTRPNATTTGCVSGACVYTCNPGWANCNGNWADGCEINTTNNTSHCGGCGNVCTAPVGGSVTCTGSTCVQSCGPAGMSLIANVGGVYWYKVRVSGTMTDNNIRAHCLAAGLTVPCQSTAGCGYNDGLCAQYNFENSCGNPMLRLAQAICSGSSPPGCPALNGVYTYMGNAWAGGCGTLSGSWCSAGNGVANQFALCTSTTPAAGTTNCSGVCQTTGGACTNGVGACRRNGTVVCSGTGTACNATPGSPTAETCNNIDDNCNGTVDDGNPGGGLACSTGQAGRCAAGTTACTGGAIACNRNLAPITEVCNGIDDDCNGVVDNGVLTTFYRDADGDGYGNAGVTTQACSQPAGYVTNASDCNDGNAAIRPGATELCNGVDDNCNGSIDEGVRNTYYRDADGDGYGNAGVTTLACSRPAGYVTNASDCNDGNAAIRPGATEVCNNVDDNCSGAIDEGNPGGGVGCATGQAGRCAAGTTACTGGTIVCNRNLAPTTETCNNVDDNCNGSVDEGNPGGGGYCGTGQAGRCAAGTITCSGGGYICVRNLAPIAEACNNVDDNCNGAIDDGNPGGGVGCSTGQAGRCAAGTTACSGGGIVCNRNLGPVAEVCNGVDDDCDGTIDDGVLNTYWRDADGDGYGNPSVTTTACSPPGGWVSNNADCNDSNFAVRPGAPEVCNSIDDNCNGSIDEGAALLNVAPAATASVNHTVWGNPWAPYQANNGTFEPASCGVWAWMLAGTVPNGQYIQYNWSTPRRISTIFVDTQSTCTSGCSGVGRTLGGAQIQWWNGSTWINAGAVNGQSNDWSFTFPAPVTTTAIRLFNVYTQPGCGQNSNPMIFEWTANGC